MGQQASTPMNDRLPKDPWGATEVRAAGPENTPYGEPQSAEGSVHAIT